MMQKGSEKTSASLAVQHLYRAFARRWAHAGGYPLHRVKNKWWKYFEKAVELFKGEKEYNPDDFIDALFNKHGYLYPQQLANKKAWNEFLEYRKELKVKVKKEEESQFIKMQADYDAIMKIATTKNINNIVDAIKDPFCLEMISRMQMDDLLLSFSRTYTDNYVDKAIIRKKINVLKEKVVRDFLKEKFKEDLFIDDVKSMIKELR